MHLFIGIIRLMRLLNILIKGFDHHDHLVALEWLLVIGVLVVVNTGVIADTPAGHRNQ